MWIDTIAMTPHTVLDSILLPITQFVIFSPIPAASIPWVAIIPILADDLLAFSMPLILIDSNVPILSKRTIVNNKYIVPNTT